MLLFALLAIAVLFSIYAEKKKSIIGLIMVILVLSLACGLRHESVGTDTIHYISYLSQVKNGTPEFMKEEPGFWYLSKVIMNIFDDYRPVLIFFSFAIHVLIIGRLWSLKTMGSFSLMVFLYCCIFFPQSFNIVRQYVSLAIVFYGTIWLDKKNYWFFLISILLATLFHASAWLAFLIVPIHYWIYQRVAGKKIVFLGMCALCIPLVVSVWMDIYTDYSSYFDTVEFEFSFLMVVRFVILLSYIFLLKNIVYRQDVINEDDRKRESFFLIMYLASMPLLLLGCFFDQMSRISLYFLIFELPFFSVICRNNKIKNVYKFACIFIALYFIVVKVAINHESEIFPYKMFFMR